MSGFISRPLSATYSSTKFALEALSDTLRMELGCHDVGLILCTENTLPSRLMHRSSPFQHNAGVGLGAPAGIHQVGHF